MPWSLVSVQVSKENSFLIYSKCTFCMCITSSKPSQRPDVYKRESVLAKENIKLLGVKYLQSIFETLVASRLVSPQEIKYNVTHSTDTADCMDTYSSMRKLGSKRIATHTELNVLR